MKKLNELEKEIAELKDYIYCQQNGNDMYFSSPLYQKQLFELQALETEEMVLKGKMLPSPIDFDDVAAPKKSILDKLAESNGIWYANCHKDLSLEDLGKISHGKLEN